MDDLYEILELTKEASEDDIKKAYKKLAMKHHPDKGGNAENFKKINEAFKILGDPQLREKYDNQSNPKNINFEEFFNQFNFFKDFNPFSVHKSPKILKHFEIILTLEEMYNGKEMVVNVKRKNLCPKCNGEGGHGPTYACNNCNGMGRIRRVVQFGNMIHHTQISICNECHGQRQFKKYKCDMCDEGSIIEIQEIHLSINSGVKHNEKIILHQKGDYNHHTKLCDDIMIIVNL